MGSAKKKTKQAKPAPSVKPVKEVLPPADVSTEYRRLIIFWIVALLLVAGQFFVAFRWVRPTVINGEGRPQLMLILLGGLALLEFVASIWLWRNVMLEAERKKDLLLAQKGYFTAWLLCLAAGPLGYVIAWSDDGRFFYGFFILAALGVLYHQPARELLVAAAPRVEPKKSADPVAPIASSTAEAPEITEEENDVVTDPVATNS